MEKLQIVVTGANGFLAKNLRKYLSSRNYHVISISRNNFKSFKNEQKIITKNYSEKSLINKIKNSDVLIHLVGIGKQTVDQDYESVNVQLTKNVVDICKKSKIKKIVYTSGLGVSSKTTVGYFISKYKAEQSIINSKLKYSIFRPSYIVGKDDLLTKSLKKSIRTKSVKIPGSGNYFLQPVHIDDVTQIIEKSFLESQFENKIIDLVGPELLTFEKYVNLFVRGTKTKIKKIDLEKSYNLAINHPNAKYGIDDLNILIGNFRGNHNEVKKLSKMKFQLVSKLLKTGALL